MFEVGVYEAKTNFSKILRRVQKGEECVITSRGMQVVQIVPVKKKKLLIKDQWEQLRKLSKTINAKATTEEILSWRDEGRK